MPEATAQEFAGEEGVDDEDLHLVSEMPEDVSVGDEYEQQAWTTEGFVGIHYGDDEDDEEQAVSKVNDDGNLHLASDMSSKLFVGDENNNQVHTTEDFVGIYDGDDEDGRSQGSLRLERAVSDGEDLHLVSEMPGEYSVGDEYKEQEFTTEESIDIQNGDDEDDRRKASSRQERAVSDDEDLYLMSEMQEEYSVGDKYKEQEYTTEEFTDIQDGDDKDDRRKGSSRQERAVSDDEDLHLMSEMPEEYFVGDDYKEQEYTTEESIDIQDGDDEDGSGEGSSSWQEQAVPEESNVEDTDEPFSMPASDIRWNGFAMAHVRRRDDPVNTNKQKQKAAEGDASSAQTTLVIIFITGGSLVILLMAAFFVFAW